MVGSFSPPAAKRRLVPFLPIDPHALPSPRPVPAVPTPVVPAPSALPSSTAQQRAIDNSHRHNVYRNIDPVVAGLQPVANLTPLNERLDAVLALVTVERKIEIYASLVALTQLTLSREPLKPTGLEQLAHEVMSGNVLDLNAVKQFAVRAQLPFDQVWEPLTYIAAAHNVEKVLTSGNQAGASHAPPPPLLPAKRPREPSGTVAVAPPETIPPATPADEKASEMRLETMARSLFPKLCEVAHDEAHTDFERVMHALWAQAEQSIQNDTRPYNMVAAGRYPVSVVHAALVFNDILKANLPEYAQLSHEQRQMYTHDMAYVATELDAMAAKAPVSKGDRKRGTFGSTQAVLNRHLQVFGGAEIADWSRIQRGLMTDGKSQGRAVQLGLEFATWTTRYVSQVFSEEAMASMVPGTVTQIIKTMLLDEKGKYQIQLVRRIQDYVIEAFKLGPSNQEFERIAHALAGR
jgi:hypothetical protein